MTNLFLTAAMVFLMATAAFTQNALTLDEAIVVRVDIARTLAEIAEQERQTVGEVRRTFTDILDREKRVQLQERLIGLNRELLHAMQSARAQGQVSDLDVNAILIALQQAQQRDKLLEIQRRSRQIELNALMGESPDREFTAVGEWQTPPPEPALVTLEQALARRPDFWAAQFDVALARSAQRLAKAERFEDWRVGLDYQREHSFVDGAPPQGVDQFVGVKLAVPLPLFDRKQGRIRETRAQEARARKTGGGRAGDVDEGAAGAYRPSD